MGTLLSGMSSALTCVTEMWPRKLCIFLAIWGWHGPDGVRLKACLRHWEWPEFTRNSVFGKSQKNSLKSPIPIIPPMPKRILHEQLCLQSYANDTTQAALQYWQQLPQLFPNSICCGQDWVRVRVVTVVSQHVGLCGGNGEQRGSRVVSRESQAALLGLGISDL